VTLATLTLPKYSSSLPCIRLQKQSPSKPPTTNAVVVGGICPKWLTMVRCADVARPLLVGNTSSAHLRHPELGSGSIVPTKPPVAADKWTLKQVQGDDADLVG
jgi:hypothetical protein